MTETNDIGTSGKGGYSSGTIKILKSKRIYVYVGEHGDCGVEPEAAFNGGGNGFIGAMSSDGTNGNYSCNGGGASDIRIESTSLYARVIVAGGGGGGGDGSGECGGHGGGTNSTSSVKYNGDSACKSAGNGYCTGSTQISSGTCPVTFHEETESGVFHADGSFGSGGGGPLVPYNGSLFIGFASGGGGWYGGNGNVATASTGGSGWIYTASTYSYWAANSPEGQSGNWLLGTNYYLTNAATMVGNTTFKSPSGVNEIGHRGDGYARVTWLGDTI